MINLIRKEDFVIINEDDFLFFGEVKEGKRNGLGILIKDNFSYEGHWVDDQRYHGIEKTLVGTY